MSGLRLTARRSTGKAITTGPLSSFLTYRRPGCELNVAMNRAGVYSTASLAQMVFGEPHHSFRNLIDGQQSGRHVAFDPLGRRQRLPILTRTVGRDPARRQTIHPN